MRYKLQIGAFPLGEIKLLPNNRWKASAYTDIATFRQEFARSKLADAQAFVTKYLPEQARDHVTMAPYGAKES